MAKLSRCQAPMTPSCRMSQRSCLNWPRMVSGFTDSADTSWTQLMCQMSRNALYARLGCRSLQYRCTSSEAVRQSRRKRQQAGLATRNRIGKKCSRVREPRQARARSKCTGSGDLRDQLTIRVEMKRITKPNYKLTSPSDLRTLLRVSAAY
jgi:hypothetical protein